MNHPTPQDRLSIEQAAIYIGRRANTLNFYRCKKIGPVYYKSGKSVFYLRKDLDNFIMGRRVAPKNN